MGISVTARAVLEKATGRGKKKIHDMFAEIKPFFLSSMLVRHLTDCNCIKMMLILILNAVKGKE
jgi:translation initiation factor 2B subunit (eIF-2B alpha/beta/delta family)